MTDQTPEARLAAALLAALKDTGYLLTHEYADSGVIDVGDAMVRADPTLAADLALAAAVRDAFGDYFDKHEYDADAEWCLKHLPRPAVIAAALTAAKEAERE